MQMAESLAHKNKELVVQNRNLNHELELQKQENKSIAQTHLKELENLKLEHSQELYMMKRM